MHRSLPFLAALLLLLAATQPPAATAATLTWSSGGTNGFWTNSANWVGNFIPANGDSLLFPATATRFTSTNTAGGPTNLASITFSGSNYVILSPPLTLTAGLTNSSNSGTNQLAAVITAGGNQVWRQPTNGATVILSSNLNLANFQLVLNGAGTLQALGNITGSGNGGTQLDIEGGVLKLAGAANSIPNLAVNSGTLEVDGVLSGGLTIAAAGILRGTGTVPAFTCNGGQFQPASPIVAGQLTVASGATVFNSSSQFEVDLLGSTAPGVDYDQVKVSTPPNLSGANLDLFVNYSAQVGEKYVIMTNTSASPFTTTFFFRPEGAILANASPNNEFWLSYVGGDGNDVMLTRVPLGTQASGRKYGMDVSHFQGDTGIAQSTWTEIFAEAQRFTFVKATEGLTVVDGATANNMTRAAAAGIQAGVYHFAHPESHPDTNGAVQEADYFLSNAGNFIGPGWLRPVLDLETGSTLGASNLTSWVIAFANEIVTNRGAGAAPIIYTLESYANSFLDTRVANYDLWIRAISTNSNPATDAPPAQGFSTAIGVFTNWSFWQYNDAGSVGGISPLDLDVCHSDVKPLTSFVIPAVTNPVAPTIATQPQSRTVTVGNVYSFSVGVSLSASTPLAYQWRFNGTNLAGATASAYSQTNAQSTNAGNYTVIITNAAGSVTSAVAVLVVNQPPPTVPPVVLYQENFDEYSSPVVVTNPATTNGFKVFFGAASGPVDFTANFGFDYSAVTFPTAIPSAPHSTNGTTRGLLLTVNKDATGAAAAVNLYPTGQVFTGNFALRADMWLNYSNDASSTEHALFGVNHSANITNRVGQATSDGLFFAVDGDGGISAGSATVRDFSLFRGGGAGAIPVLLATNNTTFGPQPLLGPNFDNLDPGFVALFPSKTLTGFTTANGTPGGGWVSVAVIQATNVITWLLNDTVVAQYTNTSAFAGGDILLGYNDLFGSVGSAQNFVLFDNVRVETLPDLDGNGLPDAWETNYFGHSGVDPAADPDGDGLSNYQEYLAGTNPTNAASLFKVVNVTATNNNVRLDWTTVGGHNYVVQLRTNNLAGPAAAFVDLSPVIAVGGTNEGTTNFVHPGGLTNHAAFYRVRLAP